MAVRTCNKVYKEGIRANSMHNQYSHRPPCPLHKSPWAAISVYWNQTSVDTVPWAQYQYIRTRLDQRLCQHLLQKRLTQLGKLLLSLWWKQWT